MFKNITKEQKINFLLYFTAIAFASIALGLSMSIFSNYFKDAYNVSAYQRGILEIPRELPGLFCLLLIGIGSFLGDIKLMIVAILLTTVSIFLLGLTTPTFIIMSIYVFINSVGFHLYFVLKESIGLSLITDKSNVGKRLGQYGAISKASRMIGGIIVFLGFSMGYFSFTAPIKWIFIAASGISLFSVVALMILSKRIPYKIHDNTKMKFRINKKYKYYYVLAILFGAQKQIAMVFGPWVLIDLLNKGADTLSVLNIVGAFICIFFVPAIGKWIDKLGIKKMLYLDAISFIIVYVLYGILSGMFYNNVIATVGIPLMIAYGLYILDMMSESMNIIRISYLRDIVEHDNDIVHTLSMGTSLDHIVSILCAYAGGAIWIKFGPQYVFFFAAILSFMNVFVAYKVKITHHVPVENNRLIK